MTGDIADDLVSQVVDAAGRRQGLEIRGGGSKAFYGRAVGEGLELLDMSPHRGIDNYEPSELVLSARAGTPIAEVNAALAEQGQCLPFDPPVLDGKATVGGNIACGLSGPARPYVGSARDHVLGIQLINGRGELLNMGGEVMKNVAGYDVSRLMTGALGTLGALTRVSFKVLPVPRQVTTLMFHLQRDEALAFINDIAGRPLPVTATCYYGEIVFVRLSGSPSGVDHACESLGGEKLPDSDAIWETLREWRHPFFETRLPIWRIALPPLAVPEFDGDVLIEWGGGQWWLRSDMPPQDVRSTVTSVGGHATLFRGGDREGEVFQPLVPELAALHERVRHAFDPDGIFNPGRQYPVREN